MTMVIITAGGWHTCYGWSFNPCTRHKTITIDFKLCNMQMPLPGPSCLILNKVTEVVTEKNRVLLFVVMSSAATVDKQS